MVTFLVGRTASGEDIQVAKAPRDSMKQSALWEGLVSSPVETCSGFDRDVAWVSPQNQFAQAVRMAFAGHYPLVLSPDAVWVTIAQGLANHINENAEKFRSRFVSHEGKKKITIVRDEFVLGSPKNDWQGCFGEFSTKIRESIGDENHKMIVSDFSTTGPLERAVSEVVLMDAMSSYFEYGVRTTCGIPTITLEGSVDDWEKILAKVKAWNAPIGKSSIIEIAGSSDSLGLDWWTRSLTVVLEQFVKAAKGEVDRDWWDSIVNLMHGSGVSTVGGWLNWLFPYLSSDKKLWKNPYIGKLSKYDGPDADEFPSGISKVPFEWNYYGQLIDYEFLGGASSVSPTPVNRDGLDVHQAKALAYALKPDLGWAVRPKFVEKSRPDRHSWKQAPKTLSFKVPSEKDLDGDIKVRKIP